MSGAVSVVGLAVLRTYPVADAMPAELAGLTPFLTTVTVLSPAAQRVRPPAAIGHGYRSGEAF